MSTAYHLARRFPERRVVVLEARRVGNGASGRSGGMALNWINGVHAETPERARRVFNATRSGLDWIAEVIREHKLPVRFRRAGCLEAYTDTRRAEEAHATTERLASWGIPVRYLAGRELAEHLRATGVVGAVLDPTAGQLHGLDLLRGLTPVVQGLGVTVYEDTPVLSVEPGRTHTLTTPLGTVRAPALVLATNAYTPRLGFFKRGLFPLHSHVIATEPLPLERWRELGWGHTAGFSDDLDRIAYASMSEDGRLLFGGGGNGAYSYRYGGRTAFPGDASRQYAFVHGILKKYFPGARDVRVAHRWTGPVCVTMTRVCSIGVTGAHKNIFHALGYSGHGVVLANLAGAVLCDLLSDHHEPWRDLPFYQRPLDGIPPEPLRWLGYQVYTRLTGRSPRRTIPDELPPPTGSSRSPTAV
ncbi:MAG: FAD-dependent oxidoreductase [Deltaproteobacteria bacterium]|nr:FAD-dependent oxidoreductase [Deltaproteobacteria bacterium]